MDNLHEFSNTNAPSEWRKSKYSLEERMKSLKVDRVREKRSVIQPFPSDFAEFGVPANSAKWFFCTKTEIELIRMKHGDLELFPPEDHELLERQKAALFIQRLGQELNLQRSIDTSIILMHRFYVLHPIQIFPYEVTAAAAVLLGSKTEDKKRLLSQIVQALIKVMKLESSNFNAYKLEVDQVEHFMALSLAFEFTLIHPSLYISKACEILNIGNNSELRTAIDDLSVNSLIFTTFCIRYPPELIAAFCIYSVLKKENYKINHLHDGRPWFCSIDKNITLDMLDKMDFEFFTSKLQLPLDPFNQQEIAKSKVDFKRRFSSDDLSSSSNVTQSDDTQDSNNDECKSHSRVKFENERLQSSSVKHPQDIRRNFARLHNRPLSSLRHNQQSQTQLLLEDARFKFNGFNDLDSELPQAISQIRSFPPESKSKQAASIKKQKMSSDVNNNVAKLFKPSSSSSNSSEFNASTSGIKSTVPLKIKIAKPESKDSWSQQKEQHMKDLNNLIEPYETSYSSVKTKKRISHVKAVSSASEAETYFEHRRHYDEPVIHQVTHEEIVRYSPSSDHSQIFKHKKMKIEEFEETNHSAPVEMAKVDDNFSSSLDSKLEKKARKSKKHKKEKKRLKREKHMEKKKSKELMNNTNDNIKVSEPRRTPIKLLFKKSSGDGNYQVQNLQP